MYGLNHGMTLDFLPDDVMLPVQFFERLRRDRHENDGCHRLIYAVLEEAVRVYRDKRITLAGHVGAGKRERVFQEAKAWLFNESDDSPFSCAWVCDHLGIEVTSFRKGLRAWDAAGRPPLELARSSPAGVTTVSIRLPRHRERRGKMAIASTNDGME